MVRARSSTIVIGAQAVRMGPIAGAGIALAFLMSPASQDATVYVVWNASPSVPIGLYAIAHRRPCLGEIAAARLPEAIAKFADRHGYLPRSALLLKPIAAIPGNRVCRFGADVFVQGRLVARAVTEDESLPVWRGCHILKKGELFLLAEHPASFDSRYFGALHARHVIGTAVPAWLVR